MGPLGWSHVAAQQQSGAGIEAGVLNVGGVLAWSWNPVGGHKSREQQHVGAFRNAPRPGVVVKALRLAVVPLGW